MKPQRASKGHHGTWETWSARAGKALARGPLSLAEASATFDEIPPLELDNSELDAICQAGIAIYGYNFEPERDGDSSRGSQRHVPRHWLLHERLDRRELPASLMLFACPAEVTEICTPLTPASDPSSVKANWSSERQMVEGATWQGTRDWTSQHDSSADTAVATHAVDWQDTFEIDAHLPLAGLATALAPASTDCTHEVVFSHDGWREAV